MASSARRNSRHEKSAPLSEVRAIYDELAQRPVSRSCTLRTECCQFRLTGKIPHLTLGEALVAARGLRASGRRGLPERADGACPMLSSDTGRCIIYADRPFGCRTHYCGPAGGPLARADVIDLIHRLEKIDADLGGDGAHILPTAVELALRQR